jgi:hypothetical protein
MLPPLQDALPVLEVLTASGVRVGYNGTSRLPATLKRIYVGFQVYPGALAIVEAHCCLARAPARHKVLALAAPPPRGFPEEACLDKTAVRADHPLSLAGQLFVTDFGFRGFAEVCSLVARQGERAAGLVEKVAREEDQVLLQRVLGEWGQVRNKRGTVDVFQPLPQHKRLLTAFEVITAVH